MAQARVRRAPYKDFLQPALHRRFSTTASILLAISYVGAVFLASWKSFFWSWFPIGPAGIRTFFLSLCGLAVIILRIAQYHVGLRTSNSAIQTFYQNVLKLQTLETVVTYVFSGWLFSQIYLWSFSGDTHANWVTYYGGDRARLNEKPLFLTFRFIIFGVYQAFLHLFRDNDRLSLGIVRPQNADTENESGHQVNQFRRFIDQLPSMLISAGTSSLSSLVIGIFVYLLFLRGLVWHTVMTFLRPFYNLPKTNMVPTSLPFSLWLLWHCISAGFMLSFIWMAGNSAFSIFLVREPLKNGRPLTSESKDPNGSLLNGLKSKKYPIQCFAMWELAFIARDYEPRRKAIYEDIDRKDGPMWSQVYSLCLDVVKGIEGRIDGYGKPPSPPSAPTAAPPPNEKKRSTDPPKQDAIFQITPQKQSFRNEVEKAVSHVATSPGRGSQLSPIAKKAMTTAKGRLLQAQREATGSEDPHSLFRQIATTFLGSEVAWPFRQEYGRRLSAVVLGAPYGEPSLYVNAINALSQLAVHSLREDKYGNVQRDVSTIIRTYTSTIKKLEAFRAELPVHWTDVTGNREAPEVDAILGALKESLHRLIDGFGPYARDLRLTLADMRLAKEAADVNRGQQAVQGLEMRQIS